MKKLIKTVIFILIVSGFGVPVNAQETGGKKTDNAGTQRFSGDRPGMMGDPAQMQKMMGERIKGVLELSDEEWQVIGPKVMKVISLSIQQRGNPMRMLGDRPGMQRQIPARKTRPDMPADPLSESMEQLQKLLEDKNKSTAEIKEQIIKVRSDREKMEREKMTAQKELRDLLSIRQEAILISMGLLD